MVDTRDELLTRILDAAAGIKKSEDQLTREKKQPSSYKSRKVN